MMRISQAFDSPTVEKPYYSLDCTSFGHPFAEEILGVLGRESSDYYTSVLSISALFVSREFVRCWGLKVPA